MTTFVDELNTLPAAEAADLLRSCCGASAWVKQMVAKRPFTSNTQLLATADEVWKGLSTDEKREAFEHHPRIGEKLSAAAQTDKAKAFAEREQALVKLASSSVHDQMSLINRAYEQKFGFIYIVSAAGKEGHELIDIARKRLRNDTATELGIAMEEQRKITRLRLEALIGKDAG
jgi:OHCU decarboxylase